MEQLHERLNYALKYLITTKKIPTKKEFAAEIGLSPQGLTEVIKGRARPSNKLLDRLQDKYGIQRDWILEGIGKRPGYIESMPQEPATHGDELRNRKAFGGRQQKGILAVSIKAQAGYARTLPEDFIVFADQLDRVIIPDFPYDGDEFRMFQVEGDSMEYVNEFGKVAGLHSGVWVVGQRVPQEDWRENLAKYRVHVIVLARQILIKRILQDNPDEIILHSDNEELHPQERISLKDVREIWYVVRKLDWDMPPPRRIEIKA